MQNMYDRPTDEMLMSQSELCRLMREQTVLENCSDDEKQRGLDKNKSLEEQESANTYMNRLYEEDVMVQDRVKFLNNVKSAFISECIFKLYKECMNSIYPVNEEDLLIGRNLVNKFVLENGAGNLIEDFKYKNILLSEMSRISSKYYDAVLETCCDDDNSEFHGKARDFVVTTDIKDGFFEELNDLDTSDAVKLIRDRVTDSIEEFIDTNSEDKLEYEDILRQAQDKIDATTNESYIEQYKATAEREINEMKLSRSKNMFHLLVESLAKAAFRDDALKVKYVNEATLDMDKVVDHSRLIYTMLEMLNTTNMVNVDENYLRQYFNTL